MSLPQRYAEAQRIDLRMGMQGVGGAVWDGMKKAACICRPDKDGEPCQFRRQCKNDAPCPDCGLRRGLRSPTPEQVMERLQNANQMTQEKIEYNKRHNPNKPDSFLLNARKTMMPTSYPAKCAMPWCDAVMHEGDTPFCRQCSKLITARQQRYQTNDPEILLQPLMSRQKNRCKK